MMHYIVFLLHWCLYLHLLSHVSLFLFRILFRFSLLYISDSLLHVLSSTISRIIHKYLERFGNIFVHKAFIWAFLILNILHPLLNCESVYSFWYNYCVLLFCRLSILYASSKIFKVCCSSLGLYFWFYI